MAVGLTDWSATNVALDRAQVARWVERHSACAGGLMQPIDWEIVVDKLVALGH